MTRCAGFNSKFYDAYFEVMPKQEEGFEAGAYTRPLLTSA